MDRHISEDIFLNRSEQDAIHLRLSRASVNCIHTLYVDFDWLQLGNNLRNCIIFYNRGFTILQFNNSLENI